METGNEQKDDESLDSGAKIIDLGLAQHKRDNKSFYMYGHADDKEPPAENFRFVEITPKVITVWQ